MDTHLPTRGIDSDRYAESLRKRLVDLKDQRVLLADINGSVQAKDRYTKTNLEGLGRVREFTNYGMHLSKARRRDGAAIPLLRGHPVGSRVRSQVFQLAGCNWRCWYCYVDYELLEGIPTRGRYTSAAELIDQYMRLTDRPLAIDLSGGQPDLVPEWTLWVLQELDRRSLRNKILVWQDDNLSSDLLWRILPKEQISFMAHFDGHSRSACFKGFDALSFAYNTKAAQSRFDQQFIYFQRLLNSGFDLYAYATFTSPLGHCTKDRMIAFFNKLQAIHPNLPLRTIPLEVRPFSNVKGRMSQEDQDSLNEQRKAGDYWDELLSNNFSAEDLGCSYEDVSLR